MCIKFFLLLLFLGMVAIFATFNRKLLLFVPNMLLWIQQKDYLVDDNELEEMEEGNQVYELY